MFHDSNTSDPFSQIDNVISALAEAETEDERRLYLRGAIRGLEVIMGQMHARMGAIVDALTEKEEAKR